MSLRSQKKDTKPASPSYRGHTTCWATLLGECRWPVMLTAFLRRQEPVSTGRNIVLFPQTVWVWETKIRICVGKEKVPHYRGLWQLLLRIPLQSFTSGGQFLERQGQPSVSCSTLVPDRENRCLGSGDRDLAAAGRGSPLERQLSSPFPSSLETTNASQLHFWEFA